MDMEFSLVTDCSTPSAAQRLLVVFFIFWPIIALGMLRRGRSPLPLLATLFPFAIGASVMWMQLAQVIERMAISGGGIASTAAGIAEALSAPLFALVPASLVAIAALLKRHAPAVDHFTIVVALATATEVVAALLFTGWIAPEARQFTLALVWASTALVIALAIAVRMVVLARRRPIEISA